MGLSILLLIMLLCNFIFILERKTKVSTIYRKINNKALIANKSDSLEGLWRRNMLVGPKQTKPKKKT